MLSKIMTIGSLLITLTSMAQTPKLKNEKQTIMNQKQLDKKTENEIKSFVYAWYSRFDKGTNMDEITPFLPDETVEFVYPQATLNSVKELVTYAEQSFSAIKSSAHYINEISVYKTGENQYEIICPHTYHALTADDKMMQMDFIGRMKIATNLKTKKDPSGKLFKVTAYKVALQNTPGASEIENITDTKKEDFSFTDVQSFTHKWFSLIDAGDADSLMTLTSDNPLNIDILGNKVNNKESLKAFLNAQKESQNYSVHTPTNIKVEKNEKGFKVTFVLHFEGDITGMGIMNLSNITTWTLIEEDGKLKLSEYTLYIL